MISVCAYASRVHTGAPRADGDGDGVPTVTVTADAARQR